MTLERERERERVDYDFYANESSHEPRVCFYEKQFYYILRICIYVGMWHQLLNGEPDENVDLVLTETIEWILQRCSDSEKKKD